MAITFKAVLISDIGSIYKIVKVTPVWNSKTKVQTERIEDFIKNENGSLSKEDAEAVASTLTELEERLGYAEQQLHNHDYDNYK